MVVLKELIFDSSYIGEGVVVLKELSFNQFYFGRVWSSWKNRIYWFFKDLACKFCMLHGFKEPTMPAGTKAEADSPWNPEVESPASNANDRISLQTTEGVTHYVDHYITRGWLTLETWAGVTRRQPQCGTPLGTVRSHQQATPILDSPFRAEESPTMLAATEALNFYHFKTNLHY